MEQLWNSRASLLATDGENGGERKSARAFEALRPSRARKARHSRSKGLYQQERRNIWKGMRESRGGQVESREKKGGMRPLRKRRARRTTPGRTMESWSDSRFDIFRTAEDDYSPGKKPASTIPSTNRRAMRPPLELIPLTAMVRHPQVHINAGRKNEGRDRVRIMLEGISLRR